MNQAPAKGGRTFARAKKEWLGEMAGACDGDSNPSLGGPLFCPGGYWTFTVTLVFAVPLYRSTATKVILFDPVGRLIRLAI
jgi:hypothetical protein